MVLVQKWLSYQLFFLGNKSQKSIFYDILERRNTFLGYKNKRLKKSKNWYFSKVVNPWFWSKNGHFSNFAFSGKIAQSNVFYDIVERKNAFLSYKNTKLQKLMVLVQKWPSYQLRFFRQYRPGNCLLRYSRPKKNCLGYKKKKLKKSKNSHFSKGVDPWFWSRNDHFFNFFFLGNIGQANVFCDILERKNAFRGYRNKKLKKSKNWHFSKRVNPWFLSKNGHFSNFFFKAI